MVISISTSTDFGSYEWMKVGSRGWFYAGNELGSILAIIFPIVVLYSIQNKELETHFILDSITFNDLFANSSWYKSRDGLNWCYVSGESESLYYNYYLIEKSEQKSLALNAVIAIVLLAGVVGTFKQTPLAQNMGIHNNYLSEQNVAKVKKKKIKEKLKKSKNLKKRRKSP